MKKISFLSFFALSTLFAADPIFDGLDKNDFSQDQIDDTIFGTPSFNLNLGDDFEGSNRPKGKRIDLAKYVRVNLDGFYHTDDGFLGSLDAFLPFVGFDRTLAFLDLRFTKFEGSAIEGNFGIGFRHLSPREKLMWGVYGFYDRKKSPYSNFFSQISFGAEIKTKNIWGDINVYIPVGSNAKRAPNFDQTRLEPSSQQFFQNLFFVKGEEKALPGIDAEVGFLIPRTNEFRIFGGFYYFNTNDAPTIAGPFVRATYRLDSEMNNSFRVFDYITFEAGARYDSERKFDAYLGFRLTVPLGGKSVRHEKGLRKYFNDYIRRDVNVITAGNTKKDFQRLQNGTVPVEIMVADTKALFDFGVLNGQVIAVKGSILPLDQVALTDGQFLTGGYFTFNEDMQIKLSNGGELVGAGLVSVPFISVIKDNTVRDLKLTLSSFATPVALGNEITEPITGQIVINNIATNGTFVFTSQNTTMAPIENVTLSVCNSTITHTQAGVKVGLVISATDNSIMAEVRNNQFTFTDPNNVTLFSFVTISDTLDSIIDVKYFTNNSGSFAGNSNIGLLLGAIANGSSTSTLKVGEITNNAFKMTSGGTTNFGVNVVTDANPGDTCISLGADGGVNCNIFGFANSTNPIGFEFNTDLPESKIDVFVGLCDKGLSAANGDTEVRATGPNITIVPSP